MNENPAPAPRSTDAVAQRRRNMLLLAVLLEGGLMLLALFLGWLFSFNPLASIPLDRDAMLSNLWALLWGLAATGPMLLIPYLIEKYPVGPFRRLRAVADRTVAPMFAGLSLFDFAVISIAAGVGEELLFRGLLQAGIAAWIGGPLGVAVGLTVASLVFGVCHWLNRSYALIAAVMGVYLGCVFLATGNLLAPIVAHAAYDFAALVWAIRLRRRGRRLSGSEVGH